jgi:hypothetical protein
MEETIYISHSLGRDGEHLLPSDTRARKNKAVIRKLDKKLVLFVAFLYRACSLSWIEGM